MLSRKEEIEALRQKAMKDVLAHPRETLVGLAGMAVIFLVLGWLSRFVMTGYFLAGVCVVTMAMVHVLVKTENKKQPIDAQPFKLNRGKNMPQNTMGLYWMSLQSIWGRSRGGEWEEPDTSEQAWAMPGLKMEFNLGSDKGFIFMFENGDVKVKGEMLKKHAGPMIQQLSSIYGTDAIGLKETSQIQLKETTLTMDIPMYEGYTGKIITQDGAIQIFIQRSVLEKLYEIDNSKNQGGRFFLLGRHEPGATATC